MCAENKKNADGAQYTCDGAARSSIPPTSPSVIGAPGGMLETDFTSLLSSAEVAARVEKSMRATAKMEKENHMANQHHCAMMKVEDWNVELQNSKNESTGRSAAFSTTEQELISFLYQAYCNDDKHLVEGFLHYVSGKINS